MKCAGADFGTQGNDIQPTQTMSTKRACADQALMQLEDRVGALPPTMKRYSRAPPARPSRNRGLPTAAAGELAGQPTPQTQYGGPAERIFLEVAPERVACSHGVMKNAQCLRARDPLCRQRREAVGGRMADVHGEIQGWQHEKGMRNVLRINHYAVKTPPADASAYAYVLDMVVETERVK